MTSPVLPTLPLETPPRDVLVADDDPVTMHILVELLSSWGLRVTAVADGSRALATLLAPHAPQMALLDWSMPGLEGPDVCRAIRVAQAPMRPYVILLSARSSTIDIVSGLQAGADDYLAKPFAAEELRARVLAGLRLVAVQEQIEQRIHALQQAAARPTSFAGALPICSYCKSIRDGDNTWRGVEEFFAAHAHLAFSHGICDECLHRTLAQVQGFDGPTQDTP